MFSETDLQLTCNCNLLLACLFRYIREDGLFGSGNVTIDQP